MSQPERGSISYDVAARHAHVVGQGPRISAIPNTDIDKETWDLVNRVRAGAGAPPIDEMPEYMRTIVKHPEISRVHMEAGAIIFKGRIPPRERELAVLRTGYLCRAPFEWGEHVLIGKRVGLTSEEIVRVTQGSSAHGWTDHERAILRGVEEFLADQSLTDETWNALAKTWDEQQLIEFPMMVGHYVATALVQNTLRVRLSSGNPGLTSR